MKDITGEKQQPVKGCVQMLQLEDNPHDAEIVRQMLMDEGVKCEAVRVESRRDFESALEKGGWDVIVSDYALPAYDGLKALALAREKCPGVPFIIFSGTIGEEMAIESLKRGATDYILKQRPARLVPAVVQALHQAAERTLHRQAQEELLKSEQQMRQLETQYLRMQRMESIGALVGGIAHDLNNALVPLMMGIDYLYEEKVSPEARQILVTMRTSARRSADMIQQVLAFARGAEGKEMILKITLLIREMEKIMENIFPKSIRSHSRIDDDLWLVAGYGTQLHQVLMNLCINARDAMPKGGVLTLSAENAVLTEEETKVRPGTIAGRYVRVAVSDTGSGMAPEVIEKIFQPFFTTKDPGKGTGLGLSTSVNIVKSHGGFITVKSVVGQGSEFSVYLPAATGGGTVEVEPGQRRLPTGQGEWILVVDDEVAICEITKATLENYGYNVLVAISGPEAVALFAEKRAEIKLALTDTAMPFMDGRATCLALRKLNPELRIIAASGGNQRKDEEDTGFNVKVDAHIQKPYTVEKLLTTIHEVLKIKRRAE